MRIGLIDVDGHNFPNLALMKISAYHKARGDLVEWWWTDMMHYDIVHKSKIFSEAYSRDVPDPINADEIVKGGTGYCISNQDGREVFDKGKNVSLPEEVERIFPDYSIYPQYDFAVSMTSRGCPRNCPFCVVADKEGRRSVKVADVKDFWCGQKHIEVLDPNILACHDKEDLLWQYMRTGATITYNQGLDIRLMTNDDIAIINETKIKDLHFAWDDPREDLTDKFQNFKGKFRRKSNIGMVYVLVNYRSTIDEDLWRINTLRELGYDPYVMVYDKPNAARKMRDLQRWCNNKVIFKTVKKFDDYRRQKKC